MTPYPHGALREEREDNGKERSCALSGQQQSGSAVATRVWATDMTRARRAEIDMVHFCLRRVCIRPSHICFGFMHLIDQV